MYVALAGQAGIYRELKNRLQQPSPNLIEMFTTQSEMFINLLAKLAKELADIEPFVNLHALILSVRLEDIWEVQDRTGMATIHLTRHDTGEQQVK
jgi:hypothetical protein